MYMFNHKQLLNTKTDHNIEIDLKKKVLLQMVILPI